MRAGELTPQMAVLGSQGGGRTAPTGKNVWVFHSWDSTVSRPMEAPYHYYISHVSHVLLALLAFAMLHSHRNIRLHFVDRGQGWDHAGWMPCGDTMFFLKFLLGIKPSSFSASINPWDGSINPGLLGTCNHIPKETTTVTLNKIWSTETKWGNYGKSGELKWRSDVWSSET